MNYANLLILLFTMSSCGMFEHREHMDIMEYQYDEPLFQANRDFMVVPGDTGRDHRTQTQILSRTPATFEDAEQMRYQLSLRQELASLESKVSDAEYEEYLKHKDKIGGISQRIYFLRLNSNERADYLVAKNLRIEPELQKTMSSSRTNYYRRNALKSNYGKINDVALGMSKDDVLQNWGQPERRDIAGNPSNENERWAYRKTGAVKYIYFESGRVEGWSEQ